MSLIGNSSIEKLLLPGVQCIVSQELEALFIEQEAEFKKREADFRIRMQKLAGEIAVKIASTVCYDEAAGTVTIQLRIPR